MPSAAAATLISRVISMSSRDGLRSPLGWLPTSDGREAEVHVDADRAAFTNRGWSLQLKFVAIPLAGRTMLRTIEADARRGQE
jgi:hypothetical protein